LADPVASGRPPEVKPLTPVRDTSAEDTASAAPRRLITLIGADARAAAPAAPRE